MLETLNQQYPLNQQFQTDEPPFEITLHCLHSNPDDPRVFDAIKPYPKNVNLHLVSRTQNEIYNVLDEAPLSDGLLLSTSPATTAPSSKTSQCS